ncbi:MAG: DNA repair protein RadC [Crocinitomicaceae bacterium]|nr:DNA repair protein RadC [Crocinitomicaceae bacterium]
MEYNRTIKQWAEDDRPREKMLLKGRSALSDAELIAILLGSGTSSRSALDVAQDLLEKSNNNLFQLGKQTVSEFQKIKGIGKAKAISLIAAIELGRRRQASTGEERVRITSVGRAFDLLSMDLQDLSHEEFHVLYLNRANFVIQKKQLSIGGLSGTVADGRLLFKTALELNACSVILAHNHPSGEINPSEQDIKLTTDVKTFGKLIGIEVLDHLIITDKGYYSFANNGIL